jgi:hypothetical protein
LEVLDMIIDINMHALPENLFQDEALLQSFLRTVPQAQGEFARLVTVPGTDKKQIVIEKPGGCANLNFGQNAVDVKARLEIMRKAGLDKAILRTPCWPAGKNGCLWRCAGRLMIVWPRR